MVDPPKSANVTNEKEEIQNGSIDTSKIIETKPPENVTDQTQQNDMATEVISEIQNTTVSGNVIEGTENTTNNDLETAETQKPLEEVIDQSKQAKYNKSTDFKDTVNSGNVTLETVGSETNGDDTSKIVETESQGNVTDISKEDGGIQILFDVTNETEETENVGDGISEIEEMQNDIDVLKDTVTKLSLTVNDLEEENKADKRRISDLEKDVGNFYL